MRIAVVIPTYKPHLPFVPRLLDSINKQTRLPDLVVVHASSCGPEEKASLEAIRAIPLRFLFHIEHTAKFHSAGENRNKGVALVPKEIEVLSFFDSDDIMHPRRIEMIEHCFQDPTIDVVTHSAQSGPLQIETVEWAPVEKPLQLYTDVTSLSFGHFHNPYLNKIIETFQVVYDEDVPQQPYGYCSIRRHCFEKVKFQIDAYGYEDLQFLAELYREGFIFIAMDASLAYYSHISLEETNKKVLDIITKVSR